MEKTDTIILSPEELAAYMAESTISVTSTYEHSPVVLMVDDTVIGTLGNFSASIGKAKSKKTFNVSAIVASALNNSTVLHYRSTFPENKRKILYIDTEQGRYHCQQVLKRILRLADLPEYKNPDNLIMLALRKFSPKLRLAIVEQAIGTIPDLGLVIIDGIRDFLYDINSSSESTDIISKFMQWTDDRQIHIHTVLHQNKNDEHARGHIGTELNNKAETIMQGLLAHFTQIYHLYNLLIYNILRRNLQLFITEFCIFSPCIIFISNKNSDKSIEILHISPKYITSVDNLMIHIFSSTFNFLYSFTPSDRLESKS